ncbi:unnamed protein product [Heligmosomoides polygyrus]|uniref:Uncharacterized protein n=1 Tax=Heligmosomoides polygyrus TaxID=6339 RepID=A0A183GLG2_HELPZ|nr:unnamed protein product [Heligmosomoides polygyrus]
MGDCRRTYNLAMDHPSSPYIQRASEYEWGPSEERRYSEDVLKTSSNVRQDPEDVLKTSFNVRRDSEDVPNTSATVHGEL